MEQNASSTVTYYTPIGITVKTALCSHPSDTQGGEKVKGESFRAGGAEGEERSPLMADTDAEDRACWQDLSPGLVFFGSELLETGTLQDGAEVVIRERSHA